MFFTLLCVLLIPKTAAQGFAEIKHRQDGFEFWSARELMPVLGYKTWQKFQEALHRAQKSCESSDKQVQERFLPAPVKTSSEQEQIPSRNSQWSNVFTNNVYFSI